MSSVKALAMARSSRVSNWVKVSPRRRTSMARQLCPSGGVAQAFDLAGTLALGVPHPSRTLRRVGVGIFTQWDEHMSYRRHRVPPLQRTQGRGTHSRVIGEETKTEDRATRRGIAIFVRGSTPS